MRDLPEGWRMVPLPVEKIEAHERNAKEMANLIDAIPRIKSKAPDTWNGKPVQSLTDAEREEFIFSLQPESTQKAMVAQKTRKPSEDNDRLLRPIENALANPEAKSLDELTAKRTLGIEETLLVEDLRRKGRNTLGQSVDGSVSEEKRTAGIEAFTYSKPAVLSDADIKRIKKLNELEAWIAATPPPTPQKPKRPWWKFWAPKKETFGVHKDWHWIDDPKGGFGKVKVEHDPD